MNRDGVFIIIAAALLGACGSDATIETGSDLAALKLAASSYHEAATAKDSHATVVVTLGILCTWSSPSLARRMRRHTGM